jgi:HPt (histidine-containing phosphotransfer) domain-containing protein
MTGEGFIDEKALAALQELGGTGFVVQMIDLFLVYAPKVIGEAREALGRGDLEPVVRMGHSLRSSGRNLGAVRVSEVAQQVESAGRSGQLSRLPELLDEMEQVFVQAKNCLEEHKARIVV